jgi:hypothetical protein
MLLVMSLGEPLTLFAMESMIYNCSAQQNESLIKQLERRCSSLGLNTRPPSVMPQCKLTCYRDLDNLCFNNIEGIRVGAADS